LPALTILARAGASMSGAIAVQTSLVKLESFAMWLTGCPPIRLPTEPSVVSCEA